MVTEDAIAPGAAAIGEAKSYLRIEGADEDALIERLMRSAAEICERFTGQALTMRGFTETLPASFRWTRLGRTPVAAITRIEALDGTGAASALDPAAYATDIDANGDGWVRVTDAGGATRVRVTFQAGLAAEWGGLPDSLRQGAVRLAAHLYVHRDPERGGGPPAAVTALWRPWRRMGIGGHV